MRVLVVEDDGRLARPLRRSLQAQGHTVDLAADGTSALAAAARTPYDLLILDLGLPDIDGLEVCRRLHGASREAEVLMLTARDEVEDRVAGLDAGADDYLGKPFALSELLARVRAAERRRPRPGAPPMLSLADLRLDVDGRRVWRGEHLVTLSVREFELLEFLLRHHGRVLSRQAILEAVWPYDFEGSDTIVDTYIHYLREKIDSGSGPRLVHTIRGIGYVLREE